MVEQLDFLDNHITITLFNGLCPSNGITTTKHLSGVSKMNAKAATETTPKKTGKKRTAVVLSKEQQKKFYQVWKTANSVDGVYEQLKKESYLASMSNENAADKQLVRLRIKAIANRFRKQSIKMAELPNTNTTIDVDWLREELGDELELVEENAD